MTKTLTETFEILKRVVEERLETKDDEIRELHSIISRVWMALDIETFEGAKGKTIWELVAELKAKNE